MSFPKQKESGEGEKGPLSVSALVSTRPCPFSFNNPFVREELEVREA